MADRDDILYRPSFQPPKRERDPLPDEIKEIMANAHIEIPEDIPEDAHTVMIGRFKDLEAKAVELKKRAVFLLDRTIEDIDGYIGDAPAHVLAYIEEITGRSFTMIEKNKRVQRPLTDEVYTLSPCEMKCIYRASGAYSPSEDEDKIVASVEKGSENVKATVEKLRNDKNMDLASFGAKLLIMVLKMSFAIAIHYTVGYICGWLKENNKYKIALNIMASFFGQPMLGSVIQFTTKTIERALLGLIGFSCRTEFDPPMPCGFEDMGDAWQKKKIRRINCCTTDSIFFGEKSPTTGHPIELSSCFEKWVKQELDPIGSSRTPCSRSNCSDANMEFTTEEKVKSIEIARYLSERPSKTNVMSTSDIQPLSKAIYNADAGVMMSTQAQIALNKSKSYLHTGKKSSPWDCFGYAMDEEDAEQTLMNSVNATSGKWIEPGTENTIIQRSVFLFEYIKMLDDAITVPLKAADRVVIGVSNLSKWGASKQLCCYVYLIVLVASLIQTLMSKQSICNGMDISEAIREEVRWARDLRNNSSVQFLVQILKLIKRIVDIFLNKMNRSIFLAGLKLPLREMWEMIKVTISNGIAQFLDVLFGPIDQVLSGIKGLPEIRHSINNECFGIHKLFDFLQCLLGNLKWGIVNWIMQFLDFSLNDLTLIDDIYLCRTKLAFLKSLSELLQKLIDLLLGLQDCYDPNDLTDKIVDKQLEGQYEHLENYYEVYNKPEHVAYNEECTESIMDQSFMPPSDERARIGGLDAGLTKTLDDMGFIDFPEKLIMDSLNPEGRTVDLQQFTKGEEIVEAVEFGEFVKVMEKNTGIRTTEIKESLRHIFDILRGQETNNA